VVTVWTDGYRPGAEIVIPIKNGEGGYVADERTLNELEASGRVVVRYLGGTPNGSLRDIAGICNEVGNVVGLMPHPEHAVDPLTGSGLDGLPFFTGLAGSPSVTEGRTEVAVQR
jgi:phosphoribosylformylglycinamidine (FGAM) synthase-like amidotransferase family enzyme